MSGGFTNYGATQVLASVAIPSPLYVKFHTGNPGSDGVANPCTETTRKAITMEPSGEDNQIWNDADANWTGLAATETSTWFTLWDALTFGNPWFVGEWDLDFDLLLGGNATVTANTVKITLPVAS